VGCQRPTAARLAGGSDAPLIAAGIPSRFGTAVP
jgi:hypothetical protein